MKKTRYRIAHACTASDLEIEVLKFLKEGWELHGGVCVVITDPSDLTAEYFQALSK